MGLPLVVAVWRWLQQEPALRARGSQEPQVRLHPPGHGDNVHGVALLFGLFPFCCGGGSVGCGEGPTKPSGWVWGLGARRGQQFAWSSEAWACQHFGVKRGAALLVS